MKRFIVTWILVSCLAFGGLTVFPEERGSRIGDYFLFFLIGDWSYRKTNVYLDDYDFVGGWSYGRFVWDRIKISRESKSLPLALYVSGTIAQSNHDKSWENHYVFGVGVEKYLLGSFKNIPSLFKNVRFYAEYLKRGYTKQKAEEWVPNFDYRIGFDVYKDYGIGKDRIDEILWSEIWGNLSWQKTNFFIEDYDSLCAAVNIKTGIRFPNSASLSLMPYLIGEATWTGEYDFFWQNRIFLGGGLRVMPFQRSEVDLWNHFKIFMEYLRVIGYFKEKPVAGTPDFDVRIGVVFSVGLWR